MNLRFMLASCILALVAPVSAQPAALSVIDLASETAWSLSIDGGPARPVKVPGGGYNSDRQPKPWIEMAGEIKTKGHTGTQAVKDFVTYQRALTIPRVAPDQITLIEFGAVNHGAEVYLVEGTRETRVASHAGPLMPFTADLTHLVTPGKGYILKVKAFPLGHYRNAVPVGFIYDEGWKVKCDPWGSKFGFGITKYVRLAVYPALRIRDVFVRPSVTSQSLTCDVWVSNHSSEPKAVKLGGALSSWNGDPWQYPAIPETELTIPGDTDRKVTLGPIPWKLGQASYWWPNKPFREDYQARLHNLALTLREGNTILHRKTQRFGFVEWTEGPFYYLVNGVRINFISDGTPESAMSEYDCYSTSPAFLPPTAPGTGCPETWRRYMRLGICANRIHQSTPTDFMMDTADELGFMLIPETAIRGCQGQQWSDEYLPQAARELALVCRNHPSTCRYSVLNEAKPAWAGPLADALVAVDPTRPLVFEDNQLNHPGKIVGKSGAQAWAMNHYVSHPKPATMISGMGECAWTGDAGRNNEPFMERFAQAAADARRWDNAYYAGWDWINYWPNFLEGMNAQKHPWKQQYHFDRQDGVDGWGSPAVRWVQRCFHPYLVMDAGFFEASGLFGPQWPANVPTCKPGETITRILEVFNDGLSDERLAVRWTARWDSPAGPVAAQGRLAATQLKAGFHSTRTLTFLAPPCAASRMLFLKLESLKGDAVLFTEDQVRFKINPI